MTNLLVTLAIAFAVILVAIALLGLSWLIKGKSSLRPGACGRDPTKRRDDSCGTTSCDLCETPKEKKK